MLKKPHLELVPKAKLNSNRLLDLIQELAKRVRETKDVLRDYGLTEEEFAKLAQNEFFQKALAAAITAWNAPHNTGMRIGLGSLHYVETALPFFAKRMVDPTTPLDAAVNVGKFLAKLGGIGEKEQSTNESERFVININLGEDVKLKIDKPIAVTPTPDTITDQTKT